MTSEEIYARCPHYARVPKGLKENAAFRKEILAKASHDRDLQSALRLACKQDVLFWINTFGFIHEPRISPMYGLSGDVPFVTWDYQDSGIIEVSEAIGSRDLTFEKSRDQGVSWICVYVFRHQWEFFKNRSFLMVSRKMELVDDPDNPDSLFWKFDFIERYMPDWLCARVVGTNNRRRTPSSRAVNPITRSTMFCEATTDKIAVGGRKTAIFIDEFGRFDPGQDFEVLKATQRSTDSRIFNGTPNGTGNAFYRINHMPSVKKIIMDWKDHPVQSRGLYRVTKEGYQIEDHEYWDSARVESLKVVAPLVFDEIGENVEALADARFHYPFRLTTEHGPYRSPWFDNECLRTPIASLIAQEINRQYVGSGDPIISRHEIEAVIRNTARDPVRRGYMEIGEDIKHPRFVDDPKGNLILWKHPDSFGKWSPYDEYVMGADIGYGRGTSESVLVIADQQARETVGIYVDAHIDPHDFAELCAAIGWWFNEALMNWETNGPGGSFHTVLQRLDYTRLYMRYSDERSLNKKRTMMPGFQTSPRTKQNVIMDCLMAIRKGDFLVRSRDTLEEFCNYRYTDKSVEHVASMNAVNAESRGDNHGDKAIALAICWRALRGIPPETGEAPKIIPPNCLAALREHARRERERDPDWCIIS